MCSVRALEATRTPCGDPLEPNNIHIEKHRQQLFTKIFRRVCIDPKTSAILAGFADLNVEKHRAAEAVKEVKNISNIFSGMSKSGVYCKASLIAAEVKFKRLNGAQLVGLVFKKLQPISVGV